MIYKTLKKVSNYCQLLDKSKFPATRTTNGITFTNNGDGTITVNGTATADTSFIQTSTINNEGGHKLLFIGCPNGGSNNTYSIPRESAMGLKPFERHIVHFTCKANENPVAAAYIEAKGIHTVKEYDSITHQYIDVEKPNIFNGWEDDIV